MPSKFLIDLTDEVFGKWFVEGRGDPPRNSCRHSMWRCECECGAIHDVSGPDLRSGKSRQCRTCANTPSKRLSKEEQTL